MKKTMQKKIFADLILTDPLENLAVGACTSVQGSWRFLDGSDGELAGFTVLGFRSGIEGRT